MENNIVITPQSPKDLYLKGLNRKVQPRSSYNAKIAFKHKPIFDKLLDTHKNFVLPYDPKIRPVTQRTHLSDGLLWLVDNFHGELYEGTSSKYGQRDYAALKGQIRFSLENDGIHIQFMNLGYDASLQHLQQAIGQEAAEKMLPINKQSQDNWRNDLDAFLSDGNRKIFHKAEILLSQSDMDYIQKIVGPFSKDFEMKITPTEITIVR